MMGACFIDTVHIQGTNQKMTNNQRMQGLRLFVNLFITQQNSMISFVYDFYSKEIITKQNRTQIPQSNGCHKNFPIGTFFDEKRFKIYVVYRQGETYQIDLKKPDARPFIQKLTSLNFVSAHLYNNDVLIVKECRKFDFYKLVRIHETDYSNDGAIRG